MNLTKEPQMVTWPELHYLFIEKVGPFMETAPKAWNELHPKIPAILDHNKITHYLALYKFKPNTYRAGVVTAETPKNIPAGMAHEVFKGGKYAKFVLTGPYSDLPAACGLVFEKYIPEQGIQMGNNWCIENYTNDPRVTPEKDLVTEILIPV